MPTNAKCQRTQTQNRMEWGNLKSKIPELTFDDEVQERCEPKTNKQNTCFVSKWDLYSLTKAYPLFSLFLTVFGKSF